jgi:SPP1 gp7 family putative phage head morphogenesis protein
MTRAERNQYANNYELLLNRMEKRFIAKVYKALRVQISSFIRDAHYGLDFAQRRLSVQAFNTQIGPVIMQMYITAALMSGRRTRATVRDQKALTMGKNEILTAEVTRYFNQHLFDKVVLPISETTKDIILRKIIKGQEEGWSVSRIVTEIGKTDITRTRARTIVRTETIRAVGLGSLLSAWNEPFQMTKEWVAVKDNRTRHTHYNIDGQVRDLEKKFSNGLMFPGDPNGSAEETINCRCALAFEAKRDSRGRLVPKARPAAAGGSTGFQSSLIDILLGIGLGNLIENFFEE